MSHGRFNNPVVAALAGFKDLFRKQEFAIEMKIKRGEYTLVDGKQQLDRYLERPDLREGYLVIFDPGDLPWEKKHYMKKIEYNNKTILMVGV